MTEKLDYTDKAALAIAPDLLNLTEVGKIELARDGLSYCSESELQLLYGIVATVERVLIEAGYRRSAPQSDGGRDQ